VTDAHIVALPILAILILMLIFKRSAAQAGLTGLALALLLAWSVFGYERVEVEIGVAAATGGALLGGVAFVVILGWVHRYHPPKGAADQSGSMPMNLPGAAMPYLALIVLVLMTRLIAPLQQALSDGVWQWSLFDGFGGSFKPYYHPGTLLLAAFLFSAFWQRASLEQIRGAIAQAVRQVAPVTIALVAMLGLSRIMVHAGMIDRLAQAAADGAGGSWPLFAPLVGVLGTFVTGSATASNILFTDFQQATSLNLGLPVLFIVAAQGFGAAIGNIICPHNIIAGCATVGLTGQEGAVLRKTLLACMIYVLLGGVLVLLLA
jgi:lactate permease